MTEQEYLTELALLRGLTEQKSRLDVTAPIAGKIVDVEPGLAPGAWLAAKSRLLSVIDPETVVVEAYVDEAELARITPGATALFMDEADSRVEVTLKVAEIADASTRVLTEPILASAVGGPVTVRSTNQHEFVPDRALYRVTLTPTAATRSPTRVLRGQVILQGRAASLAARIWQSMVGVVIREAGA